MVTEEEKKAGEECTKKAEYPSAELLQTTCYEDYRRVLDTYDKIYEKVNIALAFSGIILLVIMSSFDYTIIGRIINFTSKLELFPLLLCFLCSVLSAVLIVWAVIQLLLLMRSKNLTVFDSISIRNEGLYRESVEVASVWLIDKYTKAVTALRPEISNKQKAFDKVVLKIIIALLSYAVVLMVGKGL